ncbi:Transmembrane and coiled-coil domain-containing protein 4 [Coemansia sp. Benny D115]|nr:Transmembrane and coiled-coil domain-containing protein 4 [Coemansia sp. Benny D115]
MESLELTKSLERHWLAALCICSARCVMAASGGSASQKWSSRFAQSVLEWMEVPTDDRPDLLNLPDGDAANDMLLLMLRCQRSDQEAVDAHKPPSQSLQVASDPDKLFYGLVLTCLGLNDEQLEAIEEGTKGHKPGKSALRPFEYDARSRATAFAISEWLDMPCQFVSAYEARIASGLERAADRARLGDASTRALDDEKSRKWGWRRYLATGAGVAVAGTLVGVTAGLAAPLMAAGMGAVGIGGLGFLATTGGAAMVGSLLGVAGGGLIGQRFNTRLRGLREFYFTQLVLQPPSIASETHHLHATMLVPGFLKAAASASPFAPARDVLGLDLGDAYTLYFETRELAALEDAFADFVSSSAKGAAMSVVLAQTALGGLLGAFTWPLAVLKLGQLIDSPWAVGLERARRAGRLLADVLESQAHGKRPVHLVGYSLGALVIFTCLQELHRRNAFGLVETAVLLGMPASSTDQEAWSACCQCVARRVVVGYSDKDWVLAFLFRASSLCASLAGLEGVNAEKLFPDQPLVRRKVVNLNLGSIVTQHEDYLTKMDDILLEVSRLI